MDIKAIRKKRGRTVRVAVAIVCSLAMVMTTAVSGAVFASDRVDLSNFDGVTLSSDASIAMERAADGMGGAEGTNTLLSYIEATNIRLGGGHNK